MDDTELNELAAMEWMQSRIPAVDALVAFMHEGQTDASIQSFATEHRSRWYPRPGGTRVVVSMEDNPEFDAQLWKIEKGAWDHEHCDMCRTNIPAMTLCWVTRDDPYVLLCDECYQKVAAFKSRE